MKVTLPATLLASMLGIAAVNAGDPAADPARGQTLYESRCAGCHSLDANRIGPAHRGVYGRRAGGVEGYAYSTALRDSDVVWSTETLDRWLTDPQATIPGQKMYFRVAKQADRQDIIAYLKQESDG